VKASAEEDDGDDESNKKEPHNPNQREQRFYEKPCKFERIPKTAKQVRSWKLGSKKQVATTSGRPREAMAWFAKAETALTLEELADSGDFERHDHNVGMGFWSIIHGEFKRTIDLMEEEKNNKDPPEMLNGRQLYWLIKEEIKRTATDTTITEFQDLLDVELKQDRIRRFQTDWRYCLQGLTNQPADDILHSLYSKQIRLSHQLASTIALYDLESTHKGIEKNYTRMIEMVDKYIEQKRQLGITSGQDSWRAAPAEVRKWTKGDCHTYYNTGHCSTPGCSWNHDNAGGKGQGKGKGKNR